MPTAPGSRSLLPTDSELYLNGSDFAAPVYYYLSLMC